MSSGAARQRGAGRWLVFLATFFWGTTATLARSVFRDSGVPALTVVELRLTFAAALLFVWLAARRRSALQVARADFGYFLVLGLFGVAAVQGSYYYSIARLGVGLAILLQYVAPSLIVLWDLVRGRRPAPAMVVAVVLALAGTALLVRGVDPRTLHASARDWAIGMSSAVIFAFYVVYSKRGLARYAPETVLFYTFVIAAGFWAVVTPPWRIIAAHYSAALWTRFALLGVFSTLVPFRCFYAGLKRLPATEAGVISTSEPVVAVLSAALFLGESLRPMQLAGAGLVIGAALLASRDHPETVAASVERS
ncbi:MAG TPA: DMT family transporter [Candidatus Eisenbacteria bacterium]|jgi:drug/metabolite transporter (DMT)-like permease